MKKLRLLSTALVLAGLLSPSASVFAANPYGINYTGGEPLGANNVTINPTLVNDLTPLIKMDSQASASFSNSPNWINAYRFDGSTCRNIKYFKVWQNNQIGKTNNLSFSLNRGAYMANVEIENVVLDNVSGTSEAKPLTVSILPDIGFISLERKIYTDSACQNQDDGVGAISAGGKIFIQTKIKLYKNGSDFSSDQLYFGITDIDAAQSYRILNPDNLLSKNNMFAKSASALQSSDPSVVSKNMYVTAGGYIYSQNDDGILWIDSGSDIFVKMMHETQKEGLEMVFGFATDAGSGIQYYAKQYKVEYKSDPHGVIPETCTALEDIISGQNPSGSCTTPNKDYELEHWIANKDVTLTDGTVIKAGQPITTEQVKQVVVDNDITFTAIHKTIPATPTEPEVAVPNTGEMTGETNAVLVSVSIIGTLLGALFIAILPKLHHKKMTFKK